jgi:hypothetical protein
MADIDVVRKRSGMSLWVIALIILAVVLVVPFAMRGGSTSSLGPTSHLTRPALSSPIRV